MAEAAGARGVDVGHFADRQRGERTTRAQRGISGMVMATITLCTPVPKIATTASAMMISGNAISTSNTRWKTRSIRAAEIGAADAQHQAGDAAHERRGQADDQRGARAVDDARQQVPAELVRARAVCPARRLDHRGEIVRGRTVRRDPLGQDAGNRHHQHEHQAERAERLAPAEIQRRVRRAFGSRIASSAVLETAASRVDGDRHGAALLTKRMRGSSHA